MTYRAYANRKERMLADGTWPGLQVQVRRLHHRVAAAATACQSYGGSHTPDLVFSASHLHHKYTTDGLSGRGGTTWVGLPVSSCGRHTGVHERRLVCVWCASR